MKYALNLAEDGRVLSVTFAKFAPADAAAVEELPEGDVSQYRYVDGSFIHDPLPEPEKMEATGVWEELDRAYQEGVDSV